MKLLVDLGNTRIKWAYWDGTRLHRPGVRTHAGSGPLDTGAIGLYEAKPETAWVASVAERARDAELAAAILARTGLNAHFVQSPATACGVRSAYAQPQRLGVDRFLALVAAHARVHAPCVLAGCGTALTLDAIGADGVHLGGHIVPGPGLMREALHARTARLGEPGEAHVVDFATNTADAVESGAWLAAAAAVERFVVRARERFDSEPVLLLSGGGAVRLGGYLALPHRIEADIVLLGLGIYSESPA